MDRQVIVLGAGMVGTATALHLALRGREVTLVDRGTPGRETSYGNAGLIQTEAVRPYTFPTELLTLCRIALGRDNAARYRLGALPALAPMLARYWWNSLGRNYGPIVASYAALIREATAEHGRLLGNRGFDDLVRRGGWRQVFADERQFAREAATAREVAGRHGLAMEVTDGEVLARAEPALRRRLVGSIHWRDAWSVQDPQALVARYAARFRELGGRIVAGDAQSLVRDGGGWRVATADGPVAAGTAVIALGPWSDALLRRLGYRLPLFVKRGYHRHFECAAMPATALLDMTERVMLAPMRQGLRVTTGAEFAAFGSPPTPVQLGRGEARARALLDLGAATADPMWLGSRPCTADMLPVVGPAPRHPGLWFHFGHGHQGFTLGPVTGRMVAEMICGEPPFVPAAPYRAERFG